jgi:hypothetical protein
VLVQEDARFLHDVDEAVAVRVREELLRLRPVPRVAGIRREREEGRLRREVPAVALLLPEVGKGDREARAGRRIAGRVRLLRRSAANSVPLLNRTS